MSHLPFSYPAADTQDCTLTFTRLQADDDARLQALLHAIDASHAPWLLPTQNLENQARRLCKYFTETASALKGYWLFYEQQSQTLLGGVGLIPKLETASPEQETNIACLTQLLIHPLGQDYRLGAQVLQWIKHTAWSMGYEHLYLASPYDAQFPPRRNICFYRYGKKVHFLSLALEGFQKPASGS